MTLNCYKLFKWLVYTLNHICADVSPILRQEISDIISVKYDSSSVEGCFKTRPMSSYVMKFVCRHLYGEDLTGLKETHFQIVRHEMNLKVMSSKDHDFVISLILVEVIYF